MNKQQIIYLYSIKEQTRQVSSTFDSTEGIPLELLKSSLNFLSATIIEFNSLDTPQVPSPPDGQKPELKVIEGGNNSGGNVV